MNYKKLGNTDIDVSTICLGTMTWGEQNSQDEGFEQMDFALDHGVNFWDTAEIYSIPPREETFGSTEEIIGNWFVQTKNRDKVILASKVCGPMREYVRGGGNQFGKMNITKAHTYALVEKEERFRTELYTCSKRFFDIVIAGSALIILSPLLILVALIIRFTSKGDILFSQKRAGLNGKVMNFPKFRSMIQDAEEQKAALLAFSDHDDSITFKMKSDPRITPIGRIIRKLSIDELPQLFLVLKGEMSMVGPRPATFDEVMKYNEYQTKRLSVKPGLTCIWQVSGRATIPFKQQVEMDRKYIESRSLLLDLKLMILTIPAILSTKGAF